MEVQLAFGNTKEMLMEFDQFRRLSDGLPTELAHHREVGDLVAILHGTVLQLELLVEDVDVVVAVEFHLKNALVKLDVVSDNAMSLLKADREVDEGCLDVDALCLTHFTRDSVDGDGFVGKRDVGRQLDDVVKYVDDLLLLGVKQEATELDNVRPSSDEFFNGRCESTSWCSGWKSGGFSVKDENEHFLVEGD